MKHPIRLAWPALVGLCAATAGCQNDQGPPPAPKPPVVKVALPVVDTVSDFEEFTGRTDAIFSVTVMARVTGYLDRVYFADGTEVEKDDMLFEIDPRPYRADLDRSRANLLQAEAHMHRLERDQKRATALHNRGAISQEEVDRIAGDYSESQAAVGVAKAALELADLNLSFTKVKAPIAGRLSRRMVDPGNLVRMDETSLTSIVSLDPLYVYFDIDERTMLRIRRLVREGKIKSRDEADVPVLAALADEKDFPHRGQIDFSDNKVDPSTGTLRVRGKIPNPKPRVLSPGLFMRVRLPVGDPHEAVLIPEEALGTDQGQKYVYVVRKGKKKPKPAPGAEKAGGHGEAGKAEKKEKAEDAKEVLVDMPFKRDVKIGAFNNGLRVITEGIQKDERVVVSGLQRIREEMEVNPVLVKTPSLHASASKPEVAGE